jgi:hypothetical protein
MTYGALNQGRCRMRRGLSSVRINQYDKLVAYLTRVMPVVVGGSTFGAQLERAARMSFGCKMCVMCGGDPRTGKPGTGFVVASEMGKGKTERQRAKHRKTRVNDKTQALFEEFQTVVKEGGDAEFLVDPEELFEQRDTTCPTCGGFGFIPRESRAHSRGTINVRPSKAAIAKGCAGSKPPIIGSGGGYYIAENAVPLCGSVGRYLAEFRAGDEAAGTNYAQVIEVYVEHGGTEVPLWLMTPPGLTLLKRTRYKEQGLERALGFLDNERVAQRENPAFDRGKLIESASRQARWLLEEAAGCWNEVAPSEDDETEQEFLKAVGL